MHYWDSFLEKLEQKLGKETYNRWIKTIAVIRYDARNIYLEAQDNFQLNWFLEHVMPQAKNSLYNNNNNLVKVHISTNYYKQKKVIKNKKKDEFVIYQDKIDKTKTLDSFYYSKKNEFPYKLFCELLNNEKESSLNPIFIHGEKGTGKTHLLMSAYNLLKNKNKKVFFVKAQTFTHHIVNAIRLFSIPKFRDTYRQLDVLIIDDIDILSGRKATQEELFHTFNTLHSQGKQIIIASKYHPNTLKEIEPRLVSRFEWGIVLSLQSPDKQALKNILEKKAKELSIQLDEETKNYLLNIFKTTLSIQKALEAIAFRIANTPTIFLIEKHLNDLILEEKKRIINHETIVLSVANHFGLQTYDILGKSQTKECCFSRKLSMYFCRKKLNLTYQAIGNIFQRDHSTVMSSIRDVENSKKEKEIYFLINKISNSL